MGTKSDYFELPQTPIVTMQTGSKNDTYFAILNNRHNRIAGAASSKRVKKLAKLKQPQDRGYSRVEETTPG